jgi:CTD nuclear envelope phosphatase 1
MYTKPLENIHSDLSSILLLDNSPVSFLASPNNGLPIESWLDDQRDERLLELLPFLDALSRVADVRSILSLGHWKGPGSGEAVPWP